MRTAGSGSESATQILKHLNALVNKHQQVKSFSKKDERPSVLETEEPGFSAIEEEVKTVTL